MRKPVIILVDDEPIILMTLKKELQDHFGSRFSIETATGAAEADELLGQLEERGSRVVLVLCDWLMPGMKGDEFLVSLHQRRPEIKSIMVTGHADPAGIERAMRNAGLHACLPKPWRRAELVSEVEACLGAEDGHDGI